MAKPRGTLNKQGGKIWADAIRKVMMTGGNLEKLAKSLVKAAEEGDITAIKEIGDRMDGKAVQSIDANVRTTITIGTLRDFT